MNKNKLIDSINNAILDLRINIAKNKEVYDDTIEQLNIKENSPIGKKLYKRVKEANKDIKKKINKLNKKLNAQHLDKDEISFLYLNKIMDFSKNEFFVWGFKPIKDSIVTSKQQISNNDKKFFKNLFKEIYKEGYENFDNVEIYKNSILQEDNLNKLIKEYSTKNSYTLDVLSIDNDIEI